MLAREVGLQAGRQSLPLLPLPLGAAGARAALDCLSQLPLQEGRARKVLDCCLLDAGVQHHLAEAWGSARRNLAASACRQATWQQSPGLGLLPWGSWCRRPWVCLACGGQAVQQAWAHALQWSLGRLPP